jgi:hypothetical protein
LGVTGLIATGAACGSGGDMVVEETNDTQSGLDWGKLVVLKLAPSILTQRNDNARTGANLREYTLTPDRVGRGFGKLYSRTVQGSVYAQPLYVSRRAIPNKGTHNVVYVATMHNRVYAFDADDGTQAPLWDRQLETSVALPDPTVGSACGNYSDISGEVGIVGTPVIDLPTGTMYLVTATGGNGAPYAHYLHALDIGTGLDKTAPKWIHPTVAGKGDGSSGGSIGFQSAFQNQRSGLLLANDRVYVGFAAYCDTGPYHGWLIGHDPQTLAETSVYNTTVDGGGGGIWHAGQGPAADAAGNVYILTGNGTTTLQSGGSGAATAFVKLSPSLSVTDWFVPFNYDNLNQGDQDLGSSGVLLVPGTNYVVGGGKESKLYVLDRTNMGHARAGNDGQIVQSFPVNTPNGATHHIHGGPVYWNGPNGPMIYVWPENDDLKAYRLGAKFDTTPVRNTTPSSAGMPGGMLSISANGAKDGVLWASHPSARDANQAVVDGELRAYDASNVGKMLWSSKWNATRDDVGNFPKFCSPTVANGKLYVPSLAFGNGLENQTTFADTSIDAPALASLDERAIAVAWTGTDGNHSINVATTTNGVTFATRVTLPTAASDGAPALAFGGGRLFLAWTGRDASHKLNIASSTDGVTFTAPVTLADSSDVAPAIAYLNGRLFLTWAGRDAAHHLNVMSSTDGVTFANKVTLGDTSNTAPALAAVNGSLTMLWAGSGNGSLNLMTSTDGVTFGNKQTLGDSSDVHPALASTGTKPLLAWTGQDDARSLNTMEYDGAAWVHKTTLNQQANGAPALVVYKGQPYMGWTGRDGSINLARINSLDTNGFARLNVYGPIDN